MNIGIVGGGIAGLSAGWECVKKGHKVFLWEKEGILGGLAATVPICGTRIEGAYHHIFKTDRHIHQIISEMNLTDRMLWLTTPMGFYTNNKIYHFGTPIDLIKFNPLSLLDRIRFGLSILYFQKLNNWQYLEEITVEEWVTKWCGKRVYEVIWKPLLRAKFGAYSEEISAAWLWGRIKPRSQSRSKGGGREELGYMSGSFQVLFDTIADRIRDKGGEVYLECPVLKVSRNKDSSFSVETSYGIFDQLDRLLLTVPAPIVKKIVPDLPEEYLKKFDNFKYIGAVMLILALDRSLSDIYWLNIGDPEIKYGGVIEQTNFVPPANYGGNHIVYFFNYVPVENPIYRMSADELLQTYLSSISKMYPSFCQEWIREKVVFRVPYATPIYKMGHSRIIMPPETPWQGLFIANITQIYPEDRNKSNSIAVALKAVDKMLL